MRAILQPHLGKLATISTVLAVLIFICLLPRFYFLFKVGSDILGMDADDFSRPYLYLSILDILSYLVLSALGGVFVLRFSRIARLGSTSTLDENEWRALFFSARNFIITIGAVALFSILMNVLRTVVSLFLF